MATKVDRRGLDRKLKKLNDSLTDRKSRFLTARFIIRMIKERTRNEGKGVARTGGNTRKLKRVSDEWAERRKKESGKHPKAATGTKSNLTFKGTMLDSLTVIRVSNTGFFIGFKSRKQAEKAEGNADRGRPFMFLSKGEITKTSEFIKRQILKNN